LGELAVGLHSFATSGVVLGTFVNVRFSSRVLREGDIC
jgi:hypothetical protein